MHEETRLSADKKPFRALTVPAYRRSTNAFPVLDEFLNRHKQFCDVPAQFSYQFQTLPGSLKTTPDLRANFTLDLPFNGTFRVVATVEVMTRQMLTCRWRGDGDGSLVTPTLNASAVPKYRTARQEKREAH